MLPPMRRQHFRVGMVLASMRVRVAKTYGLATNRDRDSKAGFHPRPPILPLSCFLITACIIIVPKPDRRAAGRAEALVSTQLSSKPPWSAVRTQLTATAPLGPEWAP